MGQIKNIKLHIVTDIKILSCVKENGTLAGVPEFFRYIRDKVKAIRMLHILAWLFWYWNDDEEDYEEDVDEEDNEGQDQLNNVQEKVTEPSIVHEDVAVQEDLPTVTEDIQVSTIIVEE